MKTVAIVGVGLIGGSFALALRRNGFGGRILGVSSPGTLEAARARGVIDEGLPLEEAAARADLIYLSHPIGRILDQLPHVARLARPSALVTDAGSTKAAIVRRAQECFGPRRAIFLGGHPMAGKAERGVEAADGNLFRGSTYVLTPSDTSVLSRPPVQQFCGWVEALGARIVTMDPDVHDRTVAFTSHLPQMASTALAAALFDNLEAGDAWTVAGGGLRDMTRLARSAYELWRDICMTNTGNIERALSAYIQRLEHVRDNLRQPGLKEEFSKAARFAARLPKKQNNVT